MDLSTRSSKRAAKERCLASGETDYVVAGPGAGSKLDEAKEQDIPLLNEEESVDFIEKRQKKGGKP